MPLVRPVATPSGVNDKTMILHAHRTRPPAPRDFKRATLALTYLEDPDAIYARSFAVIEAEVNWRGVEPSLRPIVRRMIHACGMCDLADDVRASADFRDAALAALGAGAAVVTDARMVAQGIIAHALPAANPVRCVLDLVDGPVEGTTRSAAAIDAAGRTLDGAVVVIGNAPTALFRLLERIDAGDYRPAAVIGMPVGFVGAAESKQALLDAGTVPFVTVLGRRGGSAIAAAALNALALEGTAR